MIDANKNCHTSHNTRPFTSMSVRFSKFIIKTWIQQANDSCQRVIRNQIIKLANAETEQVSGYEIRKKIFGLK